MVLLNESPAFLKQNKVKLPTFHHDPIIFYTWLNFQNYSKHLTKKIIIGSDFPIDGKQYKLWPNCQLKSAKEFWT